MEPQAEYCYTQLDRFFIELLKDLRQVVLLVPASQSVLTPCSSRPDSRIISFSNDSGYGSAAGKRSFVESALSSPLFSSKRLKMSIDDDDDDDDFPPVKSTMVSETLTDFGVASSSGEKKLVSMTSSSSTASPGDTTHKPQPRYNFNICGRCASRGNRVHLSSGIRCTSCPKLAAKEGGAFCLRCEQFLRNKLPDGNYEKNHSTSQCPNKTWLHEINLPGDCCWICHLDVCITASSCRRTLDEMSEFVLPCLQNNKALRHRTREKFKYSEPGKVNDDKGGEAGTVAEFLAWMGQYDASGKSHFILLTDFLLKNMSWKKL